MSKKTKKSRKLRKNKQSKLLNMSDDQRIEMARQKLSANNARDAISVLKLIKDAQDNNTVKSLLFQAYMLRETQLSQKGMHVEAEMVLEQAFEYLPDFSDISEDQLCRYLAKTTLPMAVDAYYSYLQKQKPSKNAQYILVDRVCQTGQWKLLDIFDKNDPMCKDRPIMKTVRKLMVEGKWEEAYQAAKPLSRMSPYAEYKLFCRGMVSFYAEDDTAMLQAFDRISDSFSFSPTIHELKVIASPMESLKKKGYAISKTDYMWEGPVHLDRQLGQLIVAVDNYRNKEVRSLIYSVAKALYPQKPDWAALHILLILLARQLVQREGGGHIIDMARSILKPQQFKLFQTKYKFRFSKYPFLDAARYLDCLPLEISEPEMQNLAKAMILFYTAKSWFEEMDQLSSRGLKYLSKELNLSYTNNEELLIELVRKGLSFDPLNQSGYELLTQLPRTSRSSKNKIEEALLIMRDKMQNDPVPCLELASLYYEKNAFRKAETVLKEAMERAPHDNRVIERNVISLMISADTNFTRNKMHLAKPDIDKARQIECKSIQPYLMERSILYELVEKPARLKELTGKYTQTLTISEAMRCLSLLYLEQDRITGDLKAEFNDMLASIHAKIPTLTGGEILEILTPIPKPVKQLYHISPIISLYDRIIPKLFLVLDDSEVIALFDIMLSPSTAKTILKELKRRFRLPRSERYLLLRFYQVAIWHLEDKKRDPELFTDILDQAKGPILEEMRALAKRLAQHAAGPLKRALESLEFGFMDCPFPPFLDNTESKEFDNDFDDGDDNQTITKKNLFDDDLDESYDDDDDDDYDEWMDAEFDEDDIMEMLGMNTMFDDVMEELIHNTIDPIRDVAVLNKLLINIENTTDPPKTLISQAVNHFEDILERIEYKRIPPPMIRRAREAMAGYSGMRSIMKRLGTIVTRHNYTNVSRQTKQFLF